MPPLTSGTLLDQRHWALRRSYWRSETRFDLTYLSPVINNVEALIISRRYDEAIEQCKGVEMDPNSRSLIEDWRGPIPRKGEP